MSKKAHNKNWADLRQAVFVRDQHRCVNCLRSVDEGVNLDPDHTVPEGVGGSDRLGNIRSLCRRCHEAKHGDGIAPTIQIMSSGKMTESEFLWFKHLMKQMIPVIANSFDVRIEPKFGLNEQDQWHLPLGDVRRLDQQLSNAGDVDEYLSLRPEDYI